jgi:TetR/AcrR family transcriptional repressor of bet genes
VARRKRKSAAPIVRARNTHSRQRQRLIEACISALHVYGPSRTTVEKVVDIADMSPGIVRFYFASKAAMLVASLQFLATEFEDQLMQPVSRLKDNPVAALKLLVDLYLDPEIASPRKVSVWYAFWGEASSRQEYYDICGQKDETFAVLVHELVARLIGESTQPHLETDGVALGLIGVLEMLWQDFAFKDEAQIDRESAKARAMSYLRSVFPGKFSAGVPGTTKTGAFTAPAAWSYDSTRMFALERERLFRDAWQLVGHANGLKKPGEYFACDLGFEQALVVCDADGAVHAFRNLCSEAPHVLVPAGHGRIAGIECGLHGVHYGLDGKRIGSRGAPALTRLEVRDLSGMIQVRSEARVQNGDSWTRPVLPVRLLMPSADLRIEADWKLVVEALLGLSSKSGGWSRRVYSSLLGEKGQQAPTRQFIAPNHLLESRADGLSVLQIVPLAPGRSLLRQFHFTHCDDERLARAATYLARRTQASSKRATGAAIESMQRGLDTFGLPSLADSQTDIAAFRRYLLTALPALGLPRPPTD